MRLLRIVRCRMLEIEVVLDEIFGQPTQQLRIGRGSGRIEIVDGIDNADTEIVAPQPIGDMRAK